MFFSINNYFPDVGNSENTKEINQKFLMLTKLLFFVEKYGISIFKNFPPKSRQKMASDYYNRYCYSYYY